MKDKKLRKLLYGRSHTETYTDDAKTVSFEGTVEKYGDINFSYRFDDGIIPVLLGKIEFMQREIETLQLQVEQLTKKK